MTKTVKALLVSLGALGLIGTGFAAWNITITGETKVERPLSPDTDGTQTLVAQGLDVSEDPTLTFHPNSGAQLAHYVVKAVDTSWYSKVNLLDASEEKVSLKVSFAGTSTNSKWEDRIAIDHAEDRTFAPATWLASSEGYSVDWNFSWKGIGSYANPAEYAQATYATPESQKEYLDAVSADLEGLQFTFTFDLVANTPVGPVNPDPVVTTVNASLSASTLDIGGTSNLTVSTNLGTPDSYSIVDKSENYDSVVSFSDGVFTAVTAGTATFKVQVGDVKSEQLSIVVNEATPVSHVIVAEVGENAFRVFEETEMLVTSDDVDVLPANYVLSDKSENFDDVLTYADGKLTGKGVGTASFKVQVGDDKSDSISITVSAAEVEADVDATGNEIEVDGTTDLMIFVNDDEYDGEFEITDKSENFDTCVDVSGLTLTGKAVGDVSFKVSVGGFKSAEIALSVKAKSVTPTPTQQTATDILNNASTGVSGTTYTEWTHTPSKTGESGITYFGQSAGGNSSIQLRSNGSNSGIVVKTNSEGLKVKSVTVEWNSNTASGRVLSVYGKNSAYESASDLYDSATRGTKVGDLTYDDSEPKTINVDDDYEYIGFRSNSGALYLESITIVWGE